MPGMKKKLKDDYKSRTYGVDGNKRPIQKSRIDKLPLGYGTVNNLDDPSQEGVDREKRHIIKYAYAVIQHDMVHQQIILR